MNLTKRFTVIFNKLWSNTLYISILLFLIFLPLRIKNLSYSDYIYDEAVALNYLRENGRFYSNEFIISQHKGPGQYVIAGFTYILSRDVYNEFIYRIPFALANCLSVSIYFLFVSKLTKDKRVALISAFLFGSNGFIVSLGRIFQYQSFNILFSVASLYFFSNIRDDEDDLIKNSLLGMVFFSLSLLFHWDAIHILPYIIYVIVSKIFLSNKSSTKLITKLLIINLVPLILIAGPYLISYIIYFLSSSADKVYLSSRAGSIVTTVPAVIKQFSVILYKIRFYNPLLLLPLFALSLIAFLFNNNKSKVFVILWVVFELLFFILIFKNTGTHIYNLFLPLNILIGLGLITIYKKLNRILICKKILKYLVYLPLIAVLLTLYYQSYLIFVDYSEEYPLQDKKLLILKIEGIEDNDKKYYRNFFYNNKIGFPYQRKWREVGYLMDSYEIQRGLVLKSLSIETNDITYPIEFYTDREVSSNGDRFILAVRRPMSLVNDYKNFSRAKNKKLVGHVINDAGEKLVSVYVVGEN